MVNSKVRPLIIIKGRALTSREGKSEGKSPHKVLKAHRVFP